MSPSEAMFGQVCLQPVIKDSGSLSLRFLSCDANLLHAQHPFEPPHLASQSLPHPTQSSQGGEQ